MADPSLFEDYLLSQNKITRRGDDPFNSNFTPAFHFEPGKGWKPTESSERIVNFLEQKSGKDINLQPVNTVMALNGQPLFGAGGGVVFGNDRNTAWVDPINAGAHVVAHEGAHSVFPTELRLQSQKSPGFNIGGAGRDNGSMLRVFHNNLSSPSMHEESHAQGVAAATLNKLGISDNPGDWNNLLDYPKTFTYKGMDDYSNFMIGPPSPMEKQEAKKIVSGSDDFLRRSFNQGYNRIMQP